MKRLVLVLTIGYVILALTMKAREAAGQLRCDCEPDCWCRKPGLSLFRWVFPRFHHITGPDEWETANPEPSEL